jgi:hypothetical protein
MGEEIGFVTSQTSTMRTDMRYALSRKYGSTGP